MVKSLAGCVLLLNFCMYVIVCAIAGWALNKAIDHQFAAGPGGSLPTDFSAIYFHIGNEATGFFVIFALIAGAVGAASALSGLHHIRIWTVESLASGAASALTAWALTLLAMGLACKEIHLHGRNSKLRTLESFVIILSGTQLLYLLFIHAGLLGADNFPSHPADKVRYSTTTTAQPQRGSTGTSTA